MRKYVYLAIADLCIVILAVICYSPGLWNLRLSDESIFRAGMSVLAGLALACAFLYINLRAMREPKRPRIPAGEALGIDQAREILKSYRDGKYFGQTARTAMEQAGRIQRAGQRLQELIGQRFQEGSLSWHKFDGIVSQAEEAATHNIVTMANRMSVLDERDYDRLKHYREDDIPDDIQEKQIELYEGNRKAIHSMLSLNEEILLRMDRLAIELSSSETAKNQEENDGTIREIEQLIEETKFYN